LTGADVDAFRKALRHKAFSGAVGIEQMQDTFLLCPVLLALVADIDKPLLGIGVLRINRRSSPPLLDIGKSLA
jgi:hypothetical protein|tara:strand:- start:1081 stop:1299 length:219 start_codon:yes stop_codon:yes gene_type:complete